MKIFYTKSNDRVSFTNNILEEFSDEIKGKKRVLIKPNIVSLEPYPSTTHPDTLETVLSFLSKFNCQVIVGDGPAMDINTKKVMSHHVLGDICKKYNIDFVNLYEHEMVVKRDTPGNLKLKISKIPFTCDYIISLPLLKTHLLKHIGLSCALKNQLGCLGRWHRFKAHIPGGLLHKYILAINSIVKTDLYIVDAREAMLNANEFRHGGYKAELGIMFAGKDPVSLDVYGLKLLQGLGEKKLLGRSAMDIGYIQLAVSHNLGNIDYQLLEL